MTMPPSSEEIELWPHQVEAAEAIQAAESSGSSRWLLEMATGLGKTEVVSNDIARQLQMDTGAKVLFLCHRVGILNQGLETFERVIGDDVEHAFLRDNPSAQMVFASFQGMNAFEGRKRVFQTFKPDHFDHVRVDEGHHGPADTYRRVIEYFKPKTIGGMTATPNRHDGKDVLDIFGETIYCKTLAEGIREGLLTPFSYNMYTDRLRNLGTLRGAAGSLTLAQLNSSVFVPKRDEEIAKIFAEELEQIEDPHGLIFCKSIAHAEHMAKILAEALPYTVAPIHSKQHPLAHDFLTSSLLDGELQLATVVSQYDEGIDVPHLNFLGFLRNSASESVWLQQLGRGLRRADNKSLVRVADLATTLKRITMVSNLEKTLGQQETDTTSNRPIVVRSRAKFNFSREAEELTNLVDSVRVRMNARRLELDAKKELKAARQADREARRQQEEDWEPRFRPLVEALERAFRVQRFDEVRADIWNLHLRARKPFNGEYYKTDRPETSGINSIISIYNENFRYDDSNGYQYYGAFKSGEVFKLVRPGKDMSGIDPLMDQDKWPHALYDDIQVIEPTPDELRRIEALLNLGLPNGVDISSINPEDVSFPTELASELNGLIKRALKELPWNFETGASSRGDKAITINSGNNRLSITRRKNPLFSFPGSTLQDRTVSAISYYTNAKTYSYEEKDLQQYVLLSDGTLSKVGVIHNKGKNEPHNLGVYAYVTEDGINRPVFSSVSDSEMKPIIKMLKDALGNEIDWQNVNINTVIEAATKAVELPSEAFTPGYRWNRSNGRAYACRGIVYKILVNHGVADVNEIAKFINKPASKIKKEIEEANAAINAHSDNYSGSRHRERFSAILQALPRKTKLETIA